MTGESADVEHVNSPIAGVSIHGLENQEIGNSDVHQEGQIGAVRTKLPNYASKTADSDTPPPSTAITATRRVKTPSQNPVRTTTTHLGF